MYAIVHPVVTVLCPADAISNAETISNVGKMLTSNSKMVQIICKVRFSDSWCSHLPPHKISKFCTESLVLTVNGLFRKYCMFIVHLENVLIATILLKYTLFVYFLSRDLHSPFLYIFK